MKNKIVVLLILCVSFTIDICLGQGQPSKKNVLFISIDDLNDWEGAFGHKQAVTPNMDKLFESGVLFTNAHASQAVCTASRNSLLSGVHPSSSGWYGSIPEMRKSYDQVMGDHQMLPQFLKENGFKTLAAGKVFHHGVSDYKDKTDLFWDVTAPDYKVPQALEERGGGYKGMHFYPFPKGGSQIVNHYGDAYRNGHSLCYGPLDREDIPEGKMFDEVIADWAIDQLGQEHEKPFFMAVGFVRPHVPYTAPREYFDLYDLDKIEIPEVPEDEMSDIPNLGKAMAFGTINTGDHYAVVNLSDTYWKELVYGYLACVSFVDAQVGKVIEALESSKYADNTIVVLWSDHGQHLGEKKTWRKQDLWEEATHVPLFFKVPGMEVKSNRNPQAVSLLDLYPSLVELCELPQVSRLEGESLVPLIIDPKATRSKPVLSTWRYKNHAVRSNDWRYIRYRDGTEELYHHPSDPGEHTNLALNPKYAKIIAELKQWLPENDALPPGQSEWEPDDLDEMVEDWTTNGSIPEWLK